MIAPFVPKMLRVGVFYDGNFFFHVSNYYKYQHPRKARLSIAGLHEFIRFKVSSVENVDSRICQIVDSHFFRGRLSAWDAEAQQKLLADRIIDDVLMHEGVTTHYLPLHGKSEKGIDVLLALEALEQAIHKRFDVMVLIAGDGDFVPLVRKVSTLGTRVMCLGWDFEFTDDSGAERRTITSSTLLNESTYPVMMNSIVDDKTLRDDAIIKGLFVERNVKTAHEIQNHSEKMAHGGTSEGVANPVKRQVGSILCLKGGYGFIRCDEYSSNVFFPWGELTNSPFEDLVPGLKVSFEARTGPKGMVAKKVTIEPHTIPAD